jgi:Zn-dependent protease
MLFSPLLSEILLILAKFNAFIAFFNLLPFGPLDGLKIIKWSIARWAVTIVLAVFLMVLTW